MVSFAGELLKKAEDLLHTGLHTSEIVAGYKAAFEKAMEILPTLAVHTVRRRASLSKRLVGLRPARVSFFI